MKKSRQTLPKVVVLLGPTGAGKTALSLSLAKRFQGEIISADSRQVYKGLDIGTEKIRSRDMKGIPHHLLSVANPKTSFAVTEYVSLGEKSIKEILRKKSVPFVVGGTGFYIDALVRGIQIPEVPPNPKLRARLEKKSSAELYELLKEKDPKRAKTIDKHNPRRLIRALEIVAALGKVPEGQIGSEKYDCLWVGLQPDQKKYTKNLRKRLEKQIRQGLLREISNLRKLKVPKSRINELGLEYRTGLAHLEGKISKTVMKEQMLLELQQYAKRQMTWFKKNKDIQWFNPKDTAKITRAVSTFLK
jgi:tRNA dimethylallyltransferase